MNFIRKGKRERSALLDIMAALLALLLMAWYFYGMRALCVAGISVGSSLIADFICQLLRRRHFEAEDFLLSLDTGLIIALSMPASVPYYIVAVGAVFAAVVVRQVFGGRGCTVFSAAAAAYVLLVICWPKAVLSFPKPGDALELTAQVGNTLYPSLTSALSSVGIPVISDYELLLGNFCGGMGTTHWIVLSVAALGLMLRRTVSPYTFFGGMGAVLFFAFFFPQLSPDGMTSVQYEYITGMLLYGMLFFACDYAQSPKSRLSQLIYGIMTGLSAVIFRRYAGIENPVAFATLVINPLFIAMDDYEQRIKRHIKVLFDKIYAHLPQWIKDFISELSRKGEEENDGEKA